MRTQAPRTMVPRPELAARLDALEPGGLGLLIASAGAGKSTVLRQWSAARPDLRIAAVALTARHDDPVVLARDVSQAIRQASPEVKKGRPAGDRSGRTSFGYGVVAELRAALVGAPDNLVLVLEDLHTLTNRTLLQDLGPFFCALPDSVRAVVTTRRDPPWALHRLRISEGLVEIRGSDLAFGADEARALVEGISGQALTNAQVEALLNRTEGWAVGLQLAAISLRQSADVAQFIAGFTGSHRLVAEYLMEEVLEQQEPEVRRFLLQTSVLDWLSADLCDAVTGAGDARAVLEQLDRRSLFLIPLDSTGELVRYHHLFAELLSYRLVVESPDDVPLLHRRAAAWLLDRNHAAEAVDHLLAAGEWLAAFELVSKMGHQLYERGEAATLVKWLTAIDAGLAGDRPDVQVHLLAAHIGLDDIGVASDVYRRLMRRTDITLGQRTAAHALYATLAARNLPPGDVAEMVTSVREAVPRLGPGEVVDFLGIGGRDGALVVAEYSLAASKFFTGDVTGASVALEHCMRLPGARYPLYNLYVLGLLALTKAWTGHCSTALVLGDAVFRTAEAAALLQHPACAHGYLARTLAHLDRAELPLAAESLDQAAPLLAQLRASVTYFDIQSALEARLAAVTDGPEEGLSRLAAPLHSMSEAAVLSDARLAFKVRLLLGMNRLAEARTLLGSHPGRAPVPSAQVELALASGDKVEARAVLDAWVPDGEDLRAVVRHRLASFTVLRAEGRRGPAHEHLIAAVTLSRDEGLVWPFLEIPAAVQVLRREGIHPTEFTEDGLWELTTRLHPRLHAQASLVAHLTARELEVLEYLPGRMKNPEIADDMFVSINTLKAHLRSIYTKLEVTERNEAVARAIELGLL